MSARTLANCLPQRTSGRNTNTNIHTDYNTFPLKVRVTFNSLLEKRYDCQNKKLKEMLDELKADYFTNRQAAVGGKSNPFFFKSWDSENTRIILWGSKGQFPKGKLKYHVVTRHARVIQGQRRESC